MIESVHVIGTFSLVFASSFIVVNDDVGDIKMRSSVKTEEALIIPRKARVLFICFLQ
jgi:hypothetical protein